MEKKSKYSLKVIYSYDIEDHADGNCSDCSSLDSIYSETITTNTIRLYHSGSKYITKKYYDTHLLHNPGKIVPNSELIDISPDDLMNEDMISFLTKFYTVPGCTSGGSGICEARGRFNVKIISVELVEK